MIPITQAELREWLYYDPDTGVFTWIKARGHCAAGTQAGYARPDGYRDIRICNGYYGAHRLAWLYVTGNFPIYATDHINGVRDNNRFANLREASNAENGKNMRLFKTNTSGTCGVSWDASRHKWKARIKVNGIQIHVGNYATKDAAINARRHAEIQHGFHKNHGTIRVGYGGRIHSNECMQ